MGISGLIFSGFVLGHMAGNLLILVGAEAYNKYSHAIVTNPLLLYGTETVLLVSLTAHVTLALYLTKLSRTARPHGYAISPAMCDKKRTHLAARTLILSGLVIFTFLILHLKTFKYGEHYSVNYAGVEMRDLHRLIVEKFHDVGYVTWYVFSLFLLGAHLSHGLAASIQSLGISAANKKTIKNIGWTFATVVTTGFVCQPLYIYFFGS